MVLRGQGEREVSSVAADGIFTRYQGSVRVSARSEWRRCRNVGGTAGVYRLLSLRRGTGAVFIPSNRLTNLLFLKGAVQHGQDPAQNHPHGRADAEAVVQPARRHERAAGPDAQPRHSQADSHGRALPDLLRGAGQTGDGLHDALFRHPGAGARSLHDVPPLPAVPRVSPGKIS